eukprot:5965880-Prymnesium_polylepis.1
MEHMQKLEQNGRSRPFLARELWPLLSVELPPLANRADTRRCVHITDCRLERPPEVLPRCISER